MAVKSDKFANKGPLENLRKEQNGGISLSEIFESQSNACTRFRVAVKKKDPE